MLQPAQLPAEQLPTSSGLLAQSTAGNAGVASSSQSSDALMEKAKEFESVFLKEMMQSMFTGLEEGGTYGNSEGSEAWQSMLIDQYAKEVSQSGGIGIASSVHSQLLQLQEISE